MDIGKKNASLILCFLPDNIFSLRLTKAIALITPQRLRIYPPLIPILTLVIWAVSVFCGPGLTDISGTIVGSDFLAFYNSGNFYLSDRMHDLYDFQAQLSFQNSVVSPVEYKRFHPFINPPFTAPFFSLFSRSTYLKDLLIWWLWGLSLFVITIILLKSELTNLNRYSVGKLFLYSFMFFPTLAWLIYGQNTTITLFLYTIIFVMLRKRKDLIAGVALGLLLYKPQLAIGISLMFLIKQRFHALVGALLGAGIWLLVGFISSPSAMQDYFKISPLLPDILRLGGDLGYPTWGIHSIFGFSSLLFDNIWTDGANIFFVCLSIACIFVIALMWISSNWDTGSKSWDMMMAATFGIGILVSPHLYVYDLMLLLLPFAIVWSHYLEGNNQMPLDGGSLLFWSVFLYIICFIGSYLSLAQLRICEFLGFPQFAVQLSTLIIFCWCTSVIRVGANSRLKTQVKPLKTS